MGGGIGGGGAALAFRRNAYLASHPPNSLALSLGRSCRLVARLGMLIAGDRKKIEPLAHAGSGGSDRLRP